MLPPLTASAMIVSAVSPAACWSGSLPSGDSAQGPHRQPVPVQQARVHGAVVGPGEHVDHRLHVERLAGPADGDERRPCALDWFITRPASTPAFTTTNAPSTVMGATVPAVLTGLYMIGSARAERSSSVRTASRLCTKGEQGVCSRRPEAVAPAPRRRRRRPRPSPSRQGTPDRRLASRTRRAWSCARASPPSGSGP